MAVYQGLTLGTDEPVTLNKREYNMNNNRISMTFDAMVQNNIKIMFAIPEREQAAEWAKYIEEIDEMIKGNIVGGDAWSQNTRAREIYISIAKEAKYFA